MKTTTFFAGLTVAISLVAAPVQGAPDYQTTAKKALDGVPAIEIPAKAATTVLQAKESERQSVAIAVIRTVAKNHPKALLQTISAICQADNNVAPVLAGVAAKDLPEQASSISVVASQAAPQQASLIAGSVSRIQPRQAPVIAQSVSEVVPSASGDVVASVALSAPESTPELDFTSSFAQGQGQGGNFSKGPGFNQGNNGNNNNIPSKVDADPETGNTDPSRGNPFRFLDDITSLTEDEQNALQSDLEGRDVAPGIINSFLRRLVNVEQKKQLQQVVKQVEIELNIEVREGTISEEDRDALLSDVQQVGDDQGLEAAKEKAIETKIDYASP